MGNAECETAKQDSIAASCAVSTSNMTERYAHEKIAFTIPCVLYRFVKHGFVSYACFCGGY